MAAEHAKRLDREDEETLALWAADCAERALPTFEAQYPEDDRPRKAIEAGRAWARGMPSGTCGKTREFPGSELTLALVREAAFAAHAAARDAKDPAARAAARAAGHAAATAHVAGHARHAAAYAVTAAADTAAQRDWQVRRLRKHLRSAA